MSDDKATNDETAGRLRREFTAYYAAMPITPNQSEWLIADAIDRLAADVAAIKAKVDDIAPEDVAHLLESEKAWVRLVEEQRDAAIRERDEARAEVEKMRMQLAACGVLADCNTTDSLERNRRLHPDYDCASVQSVIRAVEREIGLRAEVERLKNELHDREQELLSLRADTVERYEAPAAPQPAAPAAGWLTDEEKRCLPEVLDDLRRWGYAKNAEVIEAILAHAGSPPVVEVPAFENYAPEVLHLRYRDALDKAGVKWKEVGRE